MFPTQTKGGEANSSSCAGDTMIIYLTINESGELKNEDAYV